MLGATVGAGCGDCASISVESLPASAGAPAFQSRSRSEKSALSDQALAEPHLHVARAALLAGDRADNDQLGWSVAVSGDGTTALVGAIGVSDATGEATTQNGAAYVYVRTLSSWSQQAKLVAEDKADSDFLGYSVALSRDGNTALVGAIVKNDEGGGLVQSGAAYIFARTGATWKQQAKLVAGDPKDYDHFGAAVALSGDGNTSLVSSTWAGDPARATTRSGAVYVFARSSSGWNQEAKLVAKDRASSDFFGISVSLSGTGDTSLIGAYQTDDAAARTTNNGSAYVFERSRSGWVERTKFTAKDKANDAYFGTAVSLADSGNLALIGAFGVSDTPTSNNGAAYLFAASLTGWTQQAKFVAPDRMDDAHFGLSVSLSGDGQAAFVGAPSYHFSDTLQETGAAYLFERSGSRWLQRMALQPPVKAEFEHFGASVAVSGDGRQALVGAPFAIDNSGPVPIVSGIGYLYFR